jgi:multidrug efflux system membrane fusion protein
MEGRRSWIRYVVPAVLALGLAGFFYQRGRSATDSAGGAEPARGGGKSGGKGGDRPVPVTIGKASRRDVPIWLEGLASVSPWQQVTVRPQVDGRLDQVLFKEGQTVQRGDVLAQIDPRPFDVQLHQAEGAQARDKAQLADAQANLERYETLRKTNLVAQQQVDDQRALVGQAEGSLKIDQAQIESARLNLDYARVRAPIPGVVGVRLVDVGNVVRASDSTGLVVLSQIDPVAVFITLPQDDLTAVTQAMARGPVPVEVEARDGTGKLGTGKVIALDNQINTATATLRLKVEVPNPKHLLWPNQFVKARLLVDTAAGALVVPAPAVQRGPQGTFVYLVDEAQKAQQTPVEVTRTVDGLALLATDLSLEAQLVVEGQGQLRPGATVIAHAADAKSGDGKGDGKRAERNQQGKPRP